MKHSLIAAAFLMLTLSCSNFKKTLTDGRDGKVYHLDQYGDQTWIREDLVYQFDDQEQSEFPEGLYTLAQAKLACPEGFHLPSLKEWQQRISTYPGRGNPRSGRFVPLNQKDSSLYYRGLVWSGNFMAKDTMAVYWTTTDTTRVFNDESGIAEPATMGIHIYNDEAVKDSMNVEPSFLNSPDHGFSCKCIKD